VKVGFLMSLFFLFVAVYKAIPGLALIAVFVVFTGQQELAMVRYREAQRELEPLEVLPADDEGFDLLGRSDNSRFSGFTWDSQRRLWIEWRNGWPVHTISME